MKCAEIRRLAAVAILVLPSCRRVPTPGPPPAATATPGTRETPAPARPGLGAVLAAPLDPARVAAFLFGGGNAEAAMRWRPRKLWQTNDAPPFDAESLFSCRASDPLPFTEKGAKRAFVLTSANPPDHDCHACAPILGAAAFTGTPAGWRLDAMELEIEELGQGGEIPEGEAVALGPDRHGIQIRSYFINQGETSTALVLVAERGASFAEVLTIPSVAAENSGACEEREKEAGSGCWGYDSTWELVPAPGRDLFDLRVNTGGTRRASDGRIEPFQNAAVYSFDGTRYVK